MHRKRLGARAIAALTAGIAFFAGQGSARDAGTWMTCTNPASGARWQIKIDYARATMDSFPAQFSGSEISWHNASDGGNYTLDRNSGELTATFASSTGGYFLHDRCSTSPPH